MATAVMTGATAGLGEHAARQIATELDSLVIVGARGGRSVPAGTEPLPLDLNSLDSVRAFAEAVKIRLGTSPIDMLILNAGLQYPKADRRSVDGFESTFAVNHLAHYLLGRLLLPNIAVGGRLIITTSDTHDPAVVPMGPKTLDPQALANPDRIGGTSGFRAYSSSKLCNLLTARSFAASDDVKAGCIRVIAYNPGLTLGTSLGRAAPQWLRVRLAHASDAQFREPVQERVLSGNPRAGRRGASGARPGKDYAAPRTNLRLSGQGRAHLSRSIGTRAKR